MEKVGALIEGFETPYGMELLASVSALANLGLADTTLYMAPMLTAGLLYQTNPAEQLPNGFSLTLYYRLTDIHLDNAAGKLATLRPSAGLRLGYIFTGFWSQK